MAVKLDKEVFVKHHFWILAGALFIVAIVPLMVLATSVSSTVAEGSKKYERSQADIKGIKEPKNDAWVKAFEKQDKEIDAQKNKLWEAAWKAQSDIMTYPDSLADKFKNLYFGDEFDFFDKEKFPDVYPSQLKSVVDIVQPINNKGEGAVQFRGGDWDGVLGLRKTSFVRPVVKEDIWLAQEDLWVKRELLRVIRDANDSVAKFREVTGATPAAPAKPDPNAEPIIFSPAEESAAPPALLPASAAGKKDDPNHKVYRNQYWEIDLTLARNDKGQYVLRGKLTNIGKRRQSLGETVFKVYLQDAGPERSSWPVPVNGEPLAPRESHEIKDVPISDQVIAQGIYGVEQVLTWRTAPVKRIDRVEMGAHSSRTSNLKSQPPRFLSQGEAAKAAAPAAAAAGGGGKGMMETGGSSGSSTKSPSGFAVNRYIDTNDQVRRMPVGLTLLVREEHIPDVLAAFTNSKLRIQTTQFHWQRSNEKIAPQIDETPTPDAGGGRQRERAPQSPTTRPPQGGKGGGRAPEVGEGGKGGGGGARVPASGSIQFRPGATQPGGPGREISTSLTGSHSVEQEEDMNLVELSIYGIASLYERFPAKPAAATGTASNQPAAGIAPAGAVPAKKN